MEFPMYFINSSIDFVKIPFRIMYYTVPVLRFKFNILAYTNNYTEQELLFCT
jgi:hypothetical protein